MKIRNSQTDSDGTLPAIVLQLLNDEPIGFVDVGARGDIHPLVEPLGRAAAVLGFEPDAAEAARLDAEAKSRAHFARVDIEPLALADRNGAATLHEISAPTNTSLLPPNPIFVRRYAMDKWREVGQSAIVTTTLDNVIDRRRSDPIAWGEMLKIDTQGTEFEILAGAQRTLAERTAFLCVEVSFCELYSGQKLFSDVELFLRGFGFSFYGFDRVYHRSRKELDKRDYAGRERMIQADAYFFKDPGDRGEWPDRPRARRQAAIAAIAALQTGYHDLALELAAMLGPAADAFRQAVTSRARLRSEVAIGDVEQLLCAVKGEPERASVLVGKFVDARRAQNDFFDIA